jgi:Uma2 family endonuclease
LPSLQEYLVVDAQGQRCDLFRKGADGLWVLHPSRTAEPVQLASVDLQLTPEALWADLEPPADAPAAT